MNDKTKKKPGAKPDHLKIDGDWEDAMGKAVKKKRPEGGWPKPDKNKEKKTEGQ